MASENELKQRLEERRRQKVDSQRLIKATTDKSAPKGAKKAYRAFKARLRAVLEAAQKAIPALRKRIQKKHNDGPKKAVAAAKKVVGVTENPPYSNLGPGFITDCQRYTGYNVPPGVYWCGCAVCQWVVKDGGANIPNRIRLGYDGYIISDARTNSNGLKQVRLADAKKGDIIVYNFHHIELCVEDYDGNGVIHTVGGNTSPGTSGSQSNGGGVYERYRPVGDIVCVARPAY